MNKITFILAALLLFPFSANAYLDAGSGSLLIQGILGAVALVGIVFKAYWYRIIRFFGIHKTEDKEIYDRDNDENQP